MHCRWVKAGTKMKFGNGKHTTSAAVAAAARETVVAVVGWFAVVNSDRC